MTLKETCIVGFTSYGYFPAVTTAAVQPITATGKSFTAVTTVAIQPITATGKSFLSFQLSQL